MFKPHLKMFAAEGCSKSKTFKFGYEYMEMVFILLDSIEAERDANWQLHLDSFREMLPYDKAFDHYKYLSWGIIYLADMMMLPETYPDVYQNFLTGKHVVSRSTTTSCFNTVSTDMALEQSFNRDSKTKGKIFKVLTI